MIRAVGRYVARHHLGLAMLLVVLAGTAAVAVSAQPGAKEVRTCLSKKKGTLRVVKGKKGCRRGERMLVWNRSGPVGPVGPAGPPGPPGPGSGPEPWHTVGAPGEPGFSTDWQPSETYSLAFRKDTDGRVLFKGRAVSMTQFVMPGTVFVLPPGFRPPAQIRFPVASFTLPTETRIEPSGTVLSHGASGPNPGPGAGPPYVTHFDGLSFSTE